MTNQKKHDLSAAERRAKIERIKIYKPTTEDEALRLSEEFIGAAYALSIRREHLLVCDGNANMARVLSQVSFWHSIQVEKVDSGKKDFPENYKTDVAFAEELCMKLKTFKDCKKKLAQMGVIHVVTKGIPPISYYYYDRFRVRDLLAQKLFPSIFGDQDPNDSSDDGGDSETIGKPQEGEIRPINCSHEKDSEKMAQNIQLRQDVVINCDIINHAEESVCKEGNSDDLSTDLSTMPVDNFLHPLSEDGLISCEDEKNGSNPKECRIRPNGSAESAQIYKEHILPSKNILSPLTPLSLGSGDQKLITQETEQSDKKEEELIEKVDEKAVIAKDSADHSTIATGTDHGVSRRELDNCIAFWKRNNHFGSYPEHIRNRAFTEIFKNHKTQAYGLPPSKGELALKRTMGKVQAKCHPISAGTEREEDHARP